MSNRSCALKDHATCAGKLTDEHYISKAVLKLLGHSTIDILGLPWIGPEPKSIGINSLTARCLCHLHNSSLAGLDQEAGRFFKTLQEAQDVKSRPKPKSATNTFDGLVLERWFLKIGFMMLTSGNFSKNGKKLDSLPPDKWALVLLGECPMPPSWGLYVNPPVAPFMTTSGEFEVVSISGDDNVIRCIHFRLARLPFSLLLGKPDNEGSFGFRRPSEVTLRRDGESRTLRLRWGDSDVHMPVIYDKLA